MSILGYQACFWRITMHKWHVARAGRVLGLPLSRLIAHDISKYRPVEFMGYAKQFHDAPWGDFKRAWHHHWSANEHHWEFWREISATLGFGPPLVWMPETFALEMAADWMGASRQYAGRWPTSLEDWPWFQERGKDIPLAPETWEIVHGALDRLFAWAKERAA